MREGGEGGERERDTGNDPSLLKRQNLPPVTHSTDTPPPTGPYLLIVPKQFYQLRTKYSNIGASI